jgi:hypothetical protein
MRFGSWVLGFLGRGEKEVLWWLKTADDVDER